MIITIVQTASKIVRVRVPEGASPARRTAKAPRRPRWVIPTPVAIRKTSTASAVHPSTQSFPPPGAERATGSAKTPAIRTLRQN